MTSFILLPRAQASLLDSWHAPRHMDANPISEEGCTRVYGAADVQLLRHAAVQVYTLVPGIDCVRLSLAAALARLAPILR
jgi:hypothetical protein